MSGEAENDDFATTWETWTEFLAFALVSPSTDLDFWKSEYISENSLSVTNIQIIKQLLKCGR